MPRLTPKNARSVSAISFGLNSQLSGILESAGFIVHYEKGQTLMTSIYDSRSKRRASRAFTLTELLVMLLVVTLLVVILVPSLAQGRNHSRSIVCTASLCTIGRFEHSFAKNHAGRVAWSRFDDPERGGQCIYWAGQLWAEYWTGPIPRPTDLDYPIVSRPEWLTCPSREIIRNSDGWPVSVWGDVHRVVPYPDPRYWWLHNICYTRNGFTTAINWYQPSVAGVGQQQAKLDLIDRPSETVDVVDGSSVTVWGHEGADIYSSLYIDGTYNPARYEGGRRIVSYQHEGGQACNILLWDGHVESNRYQILGGTYIFTPEAYRFGVWNQ